MIELLQNLKLNSSTMDRSCTKKGGAKNKLDSYKKKKKKSIRKILNQYLYRLIKLGAIYVINLMQSTQMVVMIVLLIEEINLMEVSLEIVRPGTTRRTRVMSTVLKK